MSQTRILGIDPAPSKPNTVFDGERFRFLDAFELKAFLKKESASDDKVLVCWDAPLMELSDERLKDSAHKGGTPFHSRDIDDTLNERFPTNEKSEVSVRPYAGCPHWAVTKYCLGLPRSGDFDKSYTPFPLMTDDEDRNKLGKGVVEVHPALGLYYWIKGKEDPEEDLFSKYRDNRKKKFTEEMRGVVDSVLSSESQTAYKRMSGETISNENVDAGDLVDAAVAYELGKNWVNENGNERIRLYGGKQEGALLLPPEKEIEELLKGSKRA
jgi:hypothetical protein